MRLYLLAALPALLLGGCAERAYLLDHKTSSKTATATAELGRYGLQPDKAQCVAARLGASLSIWQLRQLNAAGTAAAGAADAAPMSVRDLLWVASQVKDPKVTLEVANATASCGATADAIAIPVPVQTDPAPGAGMTTPAAPTPDETVTQPQGGAPASSSQNGPDNYQPSADLMSALAAYEKQDFTTAVRLAKAAAAQGDSGAQQLLGGLYSFGRGVPQDHAEAARYYRLAAAQGWSEAMNNLGRAYETGQGVPRDPVEALKWYLLASTRTTEDNEMVKRNIQNLVYGMSVEQIQKAASLALEWNQGRGR